MPADSNLIGLAYVEESTFGVVPSGPPTLQNLRFTSESLKQATQTVLSQEIRSTRDIADVIRVGVNSAGGVEGELSYGTYDDFFEAGLLSSGWSSETAVIASDSNVSVASGVVTHTTGWSSTPTAGSWVKIAGFTSSMAANNGAWKVAASPTPTSTTFSVEGTLVDGAAGDSVSIDEGAQILNGTNLRTFVLEKEYTDLSNNFSVLTGNAIDQMTWGVSADAILTTGFQFIGKRELAAQTVTVGNGSNTAVNGNSVCNAIDHVTLVQENGASYDITGLTAQLSNNLRARLQVGTLGAVSLGKGTCNVNGTVNAYYESQDVMDRYLNFDTTSLAFVVTDAAGNILVFDYPSIKFTDGQRIAGGQNQDILAQMQWQAFADATEGVTMRVVRFAA